jgi:Kelch motif
VDRVGRRLCCFRQGARWTPLLLLPVLFVVGCGDGEEFHSPADDDAAADDDDDAGSGLVVWEHLFDLDPGAYEHVEWAVVHDGWLHGFPQQLRWDLTDGTREAVLLEGSPDGYHDAAAVSCQVQDRLFFLGGGPGGVIGSEWDQHWEVLDLSPPAWGPGGIHGLAVHHAGIAAAEERCILLGGLFSSDRLTTVQEFDPESGGWSELPEMPVPLLMPFAALAGDRLLLAGGGREYVEGDSGSTGWGVAVDQVWLLEPAASGSTWKEAAPLPVAMVRGLGWGTSIGYGDSFSWDGRFYIVGGLSNDGYGEMPWRTWSWAPGEPQWRDDGGLPGDPTPLRVTLTEDVIYLVLSETGQGALYRWQP